ncbi:MAG: hypothetical protein ACYTF1_08795, partial [Planctomycetota bacterium]
MKKQLLFVICVLSVVGWFASLQHVQAQVIDDPLIGGTTGTVSDGNDGTFLPGGGWRVDHYLDYIAWDIVPTIIHGAYEYDIKGLDSGCYWPNPPTQKAELSHMYDNSYGNPDENYGHYNDNPYKHAFRKQCRTDWLQDYKLEIVWRILDMPHPHEKDGGYLLQYDPTTTYRFRVEWEPDGQGGTTTRAFRTENGNTIQVQSDWNMPGIWNPSEHRFKIAS